MLFSFRVLLLRSGEKKEKKKEEEKEKRRKKNLYLGVASTRRYLFEQQTAVSQKEKEKARKKCVSVFNLYDKQHLTKANETKNKQTKSRKVRGIL